MLFAVHLHDASDKLHVRQAQMQAHLAFLKKHDATIRVAGSLRRETDDTPEGCLWIVEAPDYDTVRQLIAEDPFTTTGLRANVEIHRLAKAFPTVKNPI